MKNLNDSGDYEGLYAGNLRQNGPDGAGSGLKRAQKYPRRAWARVSGLAGGLIWAAGPCFWGPGRNMSASHTETARNGPSWRFSGYPGVVGTPGGKAPQNGLKTRFTGSGCFRGGLGSISGPRKSPQAAPDRAALLAAYTSKAPASKAARA